MDLRRLDKVFKLTNEVLFTCNPHVNPGEDHSQVIQRLNDELWIAGYMTWIKQDDRRPNLSVRPRHKRESSSTP